MTTPAGPSHTYGRRRNNPWIGLGHAELIAQVVRGPVRTTRADQLRALVQVLGTGGWADGTARADDTAAGTAGGTVGLTINPRITAAGTRRPVDDVAPRPAGR